MKCLWGLIIGLVVISSCTKSEVQKQTKIYGHAGTSLHRDRAVFPANTIESVEHALTILDADGVEIDVQVTKDSIMVLFHDPLLTPSSNWEGCISQYTYNELKNLPMDYTNYRITPLSEVLKLAESQRKNVFLDAKIFDYCTGSFMSVSKFQFALNDAMKNANITDTSLITLGTLNAVFLSKIEFPNKCLESSDVFETVQLAKQNNFNSVLFEKDLITEETASYLQNSGLTWGVFNVKDRWTTKKVVKFNPDFIISDNIATAKQLRN